MSAAPSSRPGESGEHQLHGMRKDWFEAAAGVDGMLRAKVAVDFLAVLRRKRGV